MVSKDVLTLLEKSGHTKQWLATELSLSYSTLHQKITKNTFTAEELIQLVDIFNIDFSYFTKDSSNDFRQIPIQKRPDVTVEDMNEYVNSGILIESNEANGSLLYVPYGLQNFLVQYHDLEMVDINEIVDSLEAMINKMNNNEEVSEEDLTKIALHIRVDYMDIFAEMTRNALSIYRSMIDAMKEEY